MVDASVLAPALGDDGDDGDRARARLRGEQLIAPALIDLEIASVWRRQLSAGQLDARRARLALDDLTALPMQRTQHASLLDRCWELRENVTIYDASYVALAELFNVPLVTSDQRLARATGPRCTIEVIR